MDGVPLRLTAHSFRLLANPVRHQRAHMEPGAAPAPPDEAHVARLQEMGFSEEQCREALRLSSNQARAPAPA